MKNYLLILSLLLGIVSPIQNILADEDNDGEEHEETASHIDDDLSEKVGIVTTIASPGTLSQTITVYGELTQAPENTHEIYARFPGVIKSVNVSIGDTVKEGDRLATIESNESLKDYPLHAPATGLIVQRQANPGELTQERQLFTIVNLNTAWLEFRVYPAQQEKVNKGQTILVVINDQSLEALVTHVIPAADKPYALARVKLSNTDLNLSPGQFAKGKIHTRQFDVALTVKKEAVQELGGRFGVFVKNNESYEFTPLVLGKSDDNFFEVLSGLDSGTEYVSENSYLIKADILKSEAEDND